MAIQGSTMYSLKLCEAFCCYLDWVLGEETPLGLVSSHGLSSLRLRETSPGHYALSVTLAVSLHPYPTQSWKRCSQHGASVLTLVPALLNLLLLISHTRVGDSEKKSEGSVTLGKEKLEPQKAGPRTPDGPSKSKGALLPSPSLAQLGSSPDSSPAPQSTGLGIG